MNGNGKLSFEELWQRFRGHMLSFKGRSTRREFWTFFILMMIIQSAAQVRVLTTIALEEVSGASILNILVYLLFAFVSYALLTRRLHDIGKSGRPAVILFAMNYIFQGAAAIIPLIFMFYLLYLATKESAPNNQYGPQYPETKE